MLRLHGLWVRSLRLAPRLHRGGIPSVAVAGRKEPSTKHPDSFRAYKGRDS